MPLSSHVLPSKGKNKLLWRCDWAARLLGQRTPTHLLRHRLDNIGKSHIRGELFSDLLITVRLRKLLALLQRLVLNLNILIDIGLPNKGRSTSANADPSLQKKKIND